MEKEIREEHPFVIGHDEFLPSLNETEIKIINVNNIKTELGNYIIFSDMDYNKFTGILKSKRSLSEVKRRMENSPYYNELIFEKGKLTEE